MSKTLELDARGLSCPLPVLRANKALKTLDNGDVLTVLATDPNTPRDLAAFCDKTGHALIESTNRGGIYTFVIKRGR